jgi:hypothetical protein
MLASTLSALTGSSPAHIQLGLYAGAALGSFYAYTTWNDSGPTLKVATQFQWDPKTSHAGQIVAEVLRQQGVTWCH